MNALLDDFGIGTNQEREESWRYSRMALQALDRQQFAPAVSHVDLSSSLIEQFDWAETRGARLVFANGGYSAAHSDTSLLASAVSVVDDVDTTSITIADGAAQPIHIVLANIAGETASRWHRSIDIRIERGSSTLIEHHIGTTGADVLGSLASNIHVGADAALSIVVISDVADSVSLYRRLNATIESGATFSTTHALAGGRLQRFDIAPHIVGSNGRYEGRGIFSTTARQQIDVHLDARHAAHDTASDVLWRGIANARGRGMLRGAITVAEGADGADAQLQTKNILLSANAEIDAQPVLEIYADEVKASHGATVGQLDEQALFYLRSRGIAHADARSLLIAGFAREAFGAVTPQIRERLDAWLARHLAEAST